MLRLTIDVTLVSTKNVALSAVFVSFTIIGVYNVYNVNSKVARPTAGQ